MKALLFGIALVTASNFSFANSESYSFLMFGRCIKMECGKVGTEAEGWYLPGSEILLYQKECSGYQLTCEEIRSSDPYTGTTISGNYTASK